MMRSRENTVENVFDDQSESEHQQHRPLYDTLVINRRARYPSTQAHPQEITELDLKVATSLLEQGCAGNDTSLSDRPAVNRSGGSHHFAERYNDAARRLGLSELHASRDNTARSACGDSVKATKRGFFHRLSHQSSLASLNTRSSYQRQCSLDNVCRLGGVSLLRLPQKYTATPLLIPTCLAVTGNFLARNGKAVSGVFRIPGQTSMVNSLYTYYSSKWKATEYCPQNVQMTVWANGLPTGLIADVHDVASTFKKFLRDIPGGVLGSVELFGALKEISDLCTAPMLSNEGQSCPQTLLGAQLVAFRLLSVESAVRFALIGAVFGLLAYFKQDFNFALEPSMDFPSEKMDSHALSVVFAPLLLGDLTELIDIDSSNASPAKQGTKTPKRGLLQAWRTPKLTKRCDDKDCDPTITATIDRYKAAVQIVEMLVRDWEMIVQQIKLVSLDSTVSIRTSLPFYGVATSPRTSNEGQLDGLGWGTRTRSPRPSALLKSMSQPVLGTTNHAFDKSSLSNPLHGADFAAPPLSRSTSEILHPIPKPSEDLKTYFLQGQNPRRSSRLAIDAALANEYLSQEEKRAAHNARHHNDDSNNSVVIKAPVHDQLGEGLAGPNALPRTSPVGKLKLEQHIPRKRLNVRSQECRYPLQHYLPNTEPMQHLAAAIGAGGTVVNEKSMKEGRFDSSGDSRLQDLLWTTADNQNQASLLAQVSQLNEVVMQQQALILQLGRDLNTVRQHTDGTVGLKLRQTERELKHYKTELEYFRKRWYGEGSSEVA